MTDVLQVIQIVKLMLKLIVKYYSVVTSIVHNLNSHHLVLYGLIKFSTLNKKLPMQPLQNGQQNYLHKELYLLHQVSKFTWILSQKISNQEQVSMNSKFLLLKMT